MDELLTELRVLQSHLDNLIDCVRENDIASKRLETLENTILSLNSLRELIEHTVEDTRVVFNLDNVTLALVDEKHELRGFLEEDRLRPEQQENLILLNTPILLERTFGKLMRAYLGPYRDDCCGQLFPAGQKPASVALMPLYRRGKVLGSLNLGSEDIHRYGEHKATDFLERLSSMLSVCLENTLNFELLRRTSLIDTLTGVNNRRFFDQRVEEEVNRVLRGGACLSCLFLDVDHFKSINDSFGHRSGDLVLAEVARGIRTLLRNNDVLARYGGEEFVALLEVSSERKAIEVAERIRTYISQLDMSATDGRRISVTVSIGVATLQAAQTGSDGRVTPGRLVELADQALYRAKKTGRNRVVSAGMIRPEINAGLLAQRV